MQGKDELQESDDLAVLHRDGPRRVWGELGPAQGTAEGNVLETLFLLWFFVPVGEIMTSECGEAGCRGDGHVYCLFSCLCFRSDLLSWREGETGGRETNVESAAAAAADNDDDDDDYEK